MQAFVTSSSYTGVFTLPTNFNRKYFAIFADTGPLTARFNGGSGAVSLAEKGFYEPNVAPTSSIEISCTSCTVVEG
jgi:hypothetical protein